MAAVYSLLTADGEADTADRVLSQRVPASYGSIEFAPPTPARDVESVLPTPPQQIEFKYVDTAHGNIRLLGTSGRAVPQMAREAVGDGPKRCLLYCCGENGAHGTVANACVSDARERAFHERLNRFTRVRRPAPVDEHASMQIGRVWHKPEEPAPSFCNWLFSVRKGRDTLGRIIFSLYTLHSGFDVHYLPEKFGTPQVVEYYSRELFHAGWFTPWRNVMLFLLVSCYFIVTFPALKVHSSWQMDPVDIAVVATCGGNVFFSIIFLLSTLYCRYRFLRRLRSGVFAPNTLVWLERIRILWLVMMVATPLALLIGNAALVENASNVKGQLVGFVLISQGLLVMLFIMTTTSSATYGQVLEMIGFGSKHEHNRLGLVLNDRTPNSLMIAGTGLPADEHHLALQTCGQFQLGETEGCQRNILCVRGSPVIVCSNCLTISWTSDAVFSLSSCLHTLIGLLLVIDADGDTHFGLLSAVLDGLRVYCDPRLFNGAREVVTLHKVEATMLERMLEEDRYSAGLSYMAADTIHHLLDVVILPPDLVRATAIFEHRHRTVASRGAEKFTHLLEVVMRTLPALPPRMPLSSFAHIDADLAHLRLLAEVAAILMCPIPDDSRVTRFAAGLYYQLHAGQQHGSELKDTLQVYFEAVGHAVVQRQIQGSALHYPSVSRTLSGHFGAVVKNVRWTASSLPVACKVVKIGDDVDTVAVFLQEVNTIFRLDHPHTVRVHGVCQPYTLVMEQLDGELSQLWGSRDSPLSLSQKLSIILQISYALEFMHSHEFVHCDIKPSNILFRTSGHGARKSFEIKVADFGLAHSSRDDGASALRDIRYRDPAAGRVTVRGAGLDLLKASDIYSFALVMWELFHEEDLSIQAQSEYQQHDPQELYSLFATGHRLSFSVRHTEIDTARMEEIVSRCWRPEPMNRSTAAAITYHLQEHLAAESCVPDMFRLGMSADASTGARAVCDCRFCASASASFAQTPVMAATPTAAISHHDFIVPAAGTLATQPAGVVYSDISM